MSQLTIYKASAGSGKTFTLTRRFLVLLFQEKDNYKHILAATFTNKATEEMKSRVIDELHILANGKESAHRDFLRKKLPHIKDNESLQARAKDILANILHDYSHLNITTIDRFFQRIIRSFAREIRVSSNYNIELDDKAVLQKVTEQLFFDLEKKGSEDLVNWMTSFAEEQIENGNSWNFSESIGKLSEEFLSEEYKRASSQNEKALGDFIIMKNFLSKITKHLKMLENEMQNIAQKAINFANANDLTSIDFKYGKSSGINFLYNTAKGEIPDKIGSRTLAMLENQEAFYTKSSAKKDAIIGACNAGLEEGLRLLVDFWSSNISLYNSIALIRSNFYSLGILSDLERQLKTYTNDNNILLLSNSNELIANIIDNSDTPFIYEKTGHTFKHFMIDEFQDTSQLQWNNLKPLIHNSLAEGNENLIVGDVKQSIYRWRNSDWKQLDHGIKNEFNTSSREEILPTNWRSSKNIIRFNNTLIKETAKHLQKHFRNTMNLEENASSAQLFDSAYSDIVQQIPHKAKDGGHIAFHFYDKDTNEDWKEDVISKLPAIIEQAQDNGHKLSDIAILVRQNSEGAEISKYLLNYAADNRNSKYKYNVISDEALWISSSYDVKFLINIFNYLSNSSDIYASQINLIYNNYLKRQDKKDTSWEAGTLHPDIASKIQHLTALSLLEMTEELISKFELGQEATEAIFVQSFIDLIHDFEHVQSGSINEFLTWWDERGKSRSISTPEGQDAINILTIHKSKGLEFKIVIVPFLDWKFGKDKGYLWTTTNQEPLNEIPYLPVPLVKKLNNSLFKDEYENEILLQYIDSLNVLYVAFTRAKETLIGFGDTSKKDTLDTILTEVFKHQTEKNDTSINLTEYWNEKEQSFIFGEFPRSSEIQNNKNNNLILKRYSDHKKKRLPQLRYQSSDFEITDKHIETSARKTGKIWHRLFEKINALDELPQAILQLEKEGVVAHNAAEELLKNIKRAINMPQMQAWFSPEAKVRNEATILTPEGHNYRPDRVVEHNGKISVIDFKFGAIEKNSYHQQVNRYVHLIRSMGNDDVVGYLWYVNLKKVVNIGDKAKQLSISL